MTIERIDDGEVSAYLAGEARPGDRIELRGPIGGYFTWTAAAPGPLQLVAGGSGIVPLMAMLRHRALAGAPAPARLLYSAGTWDAIIYQQELLRLAGEAPGVRLRADSLRRVGRGRPGGAGPHSGAHQDREVRTDRRIDMKRGDELRLDENAAAGPLGELFAFDITTATTTCDGCGHASPVGALMLYGQEMGLVLRCPGCGHMMMCVTRTRGETWLDLRGIRLLRVAAL